jgi:hypothetical protein
VLGACGALTTLVWDCRQDSPNLPYANRACRDSRLRVCDGAVSDVAGQAFVATTVCRSGYQRSVETTLVFYESGPRNAYAGTALTVANPAFVS